MIKKKTEKNKNGIEREPKRFFFCVWDVFWLLSQYRRRRWCFFFSLSLFSSSLCVFRSLFHFKSVNSAHFYYTLIVVTGVEKLTFFEIRVGMRCQWAVNLCTFSMCTSFFFLSLCCSFYLDFPLSHSRRPVVVIAHFGSSWYLELHHINRKRKTIKKILVIAWGFRDPLFLIIP